MKDLLFLFFTFLSFCRLFYSKTAPNSKKPENSRCKYGQRAEDFERLIDFTPKKPLMTIWPYETLYIKAKIQPKNVQCGVFQLRIVDLPLRRLEQQNGNWELFGIDYTLEDFKLKKKKNKKEIKITSGFVDDIPVHILKISPNFYKRICYPRRMIQAKLVCYRYKTFSRNLQYERCKQYAYEHFKIDKKDGVCIKYNLRWKKSIFSRKSKTFKVRINRKYLENIHPGTEGFGAINMRSLIYAEYPGFQWLLTNIKKSLKIRSNKILDNEEERNIKIHFIPLLYYSKYNSKKCQKSCDKYLKTYV